MTSKEHDLESAALHVQRSAQTSSRTVSLPLRQAIAACIEADDAAEKARGVLVKRLDLDLKAGKPVNMTDVARRVGLSRSQLYRRLETHRDPNSVAARKAAGLEPIRPAKKAGA